MPATRLDERIIGQRIWSGILPCLLEALGVSYSCGWAFLGPGTALTSDASGKLYLLWNAGSADFGPERIYFSSSDDGFNWTPKTDVSLAKNGVDHAFPAIIAGAAGDVRIAWMGQRNFPD